MSRPGSARPAEGCDVLVVGGGPAGASCAAILAREGLDVLLVDKAIFPRDKLCGDFVTPGSVAALEALGLAPDARAAGPVVLRGMRLTFEETEIDLPFPAGRAGWAIGRRHLDAALLAGARRAGARILEGFRVRGIHDAGSAVIVEGAARASGPATIEAAFVVDAGGRNAIAPRAMGWRVASRWPVRYAVGAWYEGVRGLADHGEMHVLGGGEGGYVGVSPIGPALASAAAVVDARVFLASRRDPGGLLLRLIRSSEALRARFEGARAVTPTRGAGPLAHGASRPGAGRIVITGDAFAFVDPFTGEGIQAALTGGALAAHAALEVVRRNDPRAVARYASALRRSLAPRFAMSRALQGVLGARPIARRIAAALARRGDLAAAMIAVTGGLDHPRALVSPRFAGPLLRGLLVPWRRSADRAADPATDREAIP